MIAMVWSSGWPPVRTDRGRIRVVIPADDLPVNSGDDDCSAATCHQTYRRDARSGRGEPPPIIRFKRKKRAFWLHSDGE